MKALVVGLGSPLRRDEGIGLWVAQHLEDVPGVEVLAVWGLTPELIPNVATSDLVVFVESRPGSGPVRWERIQPGRRHSLGASLSPQEILAWAGHLFSSYPEAWRVTVPARDISDGSGFSPRTLRAALNLVGRLRSYLGGEGKW
jgi:Ni,Fe-hydrogenase maturation factor